MIGCSFSYRQLRYIALDFLIPVIHRLLLAMSHTNIKKSTTAYNLTERLQRLQVGMDSNAFFQSYTLQLMTLQRQGAAGEY